MRATSVLLSFLFGPMHVAGRVANRSTKRAIRSTRIDVANYPPAWLVAIHVRLAAKRRELDEHRRRR